ncbi:MAG: penicillin acylase family protein [Pseudomonadota bacterium]
MKRLIQTITALALVAILAFASLHLLLLPKTSGSIKVEGLSHPVTIRFDAFQRPYAQATTFEDALFAEGWLHGSNRLWQMELFRRAGKGRLAELLGDDMLDADRELLLIGVPELADRLRQQASEDFLEQLQAYVTGVNAAIAAQAIPPLEFLLLGTGPEPWTAADVFAVGALTAYQSANNFRKELLRLAIRESVGDDAFAIFLADGSDGPDYPLVLPTGEAVALTLDRLSASDPLENEQMPRLAFGSNGWVVAPARSATGNALFAFDSHDALGLPNLFYEVHLFYGEGRQIRGWSAPGLPGVINGFNERIAWGFTNIGDTQDLFIERYCDDGAGFIDADECYRPELRQAELPRKDGQTETVDIVLTRNGRLISEEPAIALRWTAHELEGLSLESLFDLNRANNWQQYTAALDHFPAPTLNATYADVDGNIGFRTAGALPLRGHGEGLYPLRGDIASHRWRGIVPADAMPERAHPESGFLAAANARVNALGQGTLVSADNASPYRISRIQAVLTASDALTLEDMQALQMDWYDGQAALYLRDMLERVDRSLLSSAAVAAIALLEDWVDLPMAAPDSAAALIYQRWYPALAREVLGNRLPAPLVDRALKHKYVLDYALDQLLRIDDDPHWWQGQQPQSLATALNKAVADLAAATGETRPDRWRLDQLQRVGLKHEFASAVPALAPLLNQEAVPWAGSVTTVGRAGYRYDRPNQVSSAATVRVIAEMSEPIRAAAVIPGGQSGYPLSSAYRDQFPHWLAGEALPLSSDPEAVDGQELTLAPAGR